MPWPRFAKELANKEKNCGGNVGGGGGGIGSTGSSRRKKLWKKS
jgi:hypothetical protein